MDLVGFRSNCQVRLQHEENKKIYITIIPSTSHGYTAMLRSDMVDTRANSVHMCACVCDLDICDYQYAIW